MIIISLLIVTIGHYCLFWHMRNMNRQIVKLLSSIRHQHLTMIRMLDDIINYDPRGTVDSEEDLDDWYR